MTSYGAGRERVHLDVLDRSGYQPTQWTVANIAHLSVTRLGGLMC